MNPMKTEAIKKYLEVKAHPDLSMLYNHDMEVQVLVAKGKGEMIVEPGFQGKEWRAWTDGFSSWKSFRIPYNASTEAAYEDRPLSFSLEQHAEGIGMTGWDWKKKLSRWVAYDFDAIIGHSEKHGKKLTDKQLEEVQEELKKIAFTTIRYSTSGKGLHLYVHLEPIPTENHTQHAALARSVLSMMSGMVGFDFTSRVDICGGNMWVWHRKMYDAQGVQNNGLKLIKQGTLLTEVPANWRDHTPVVNRASKSTIPSFVYDLNATDPDKLFLELTGQRSRVTLEPEHKKVVEWISTNNCRWWWDQDNWMLVTHTIHLKEAHTALKLKGKFETSAVGSERGGDHNCFMFPNRGGSWSVIRYSVGVQECDTWEQDGKRWTKCYYNRDVDLAVASKLYHGVQHAKGGYVFRSSSDAMCALKDLGVGLDPLPSYILARRAIIKQVKGENKLLIQIDAEEKSDKAVDMMGWYVEKKLWTRIVNVNIPSAPVGDSKEDYHDFVRHVMTTEGEDAGWILKRDGTWCDEPIDHVRIVLRSMENDAKALDQILGSSIMAAWKLVNKPFEGEYPGNREWNRDAARFIVVPSADVENLAYPTWIKILENCGKSLDEDIKVHPWCRENGVSCGADYLKLWLACMFKHPDRPTPYLGFWGPQDSGKSIFHEMLSLLFEGGMVGADTALTSKDNFNGELLSAILCYVEETSMKGNSVAYRRIKDWVTSPYITIHPKFGTPYRAKNYTHWMGFCNEQEDCPVFPGDTRITLIHVEKLDEAKKIPKGELMLMLQKEGPDFLASLLNMEIPKAEGRLALPVIETLDKKRLEEKNMNVVQQFIAKEINCVDGHAISSSDFYERFIGWLDDREKMNWSRPKLSRELPNSFPRGRLGSDPQTYYGNMSFDKEVAPLSKYYLRGAYLKQ